MGPIALLLFRRKGYFRYVLSLKMHCPRSGLKSRTLDPMASANHFTIRTTCLVQTLLDFRTLEIRATHSLGHYKLTPLNLLSDAKFGLLTSAGDILSYRTVARSVSEDNTSVSAWFLQRCHLCTYSSVSLCILFVLLIFGNPTGNYDVGVDWSV
jgi:hypothetical protein